jgi:hypothetical protein
MTLLAQVAAIEQRADAATKGPWACDIRSGCMAVYPGGHINCLASLSATDPVILFQMGRGEPYHHQEGCYRVITDEQMANNAFIAAARQDVPRLCKALRVLAEALTYVGTSQKRVDAALAEASRILAEGR